MKFIRIGPATSYENMIRRGSAVAHDVVLNLQPQPARDRVIWIAAVENQGWSFAGLSVPFRRNLPWEGPNYQEWKE